MCSVSSLSVCPRVPVSGCGPGSLTLILAERSSYRGGVEAGGVVGPALLRHQPCNARSRSCMALSVQFSAHSHFIICLLSVSDCSWPEDWRRVILRKWRWYRADKHICSFGDKWCRFTDKVWIEPTLICNWTVLSQSSPQHARSRTHAERKRDEGRGEVSNWLPSAITC